MEMTYDDMKQMMKILDRNEIYYEFGNHYNTETQPDGTAIEYIEGHYILLFGQLIHAWEIDDEDDKWNRA